MSDSETVRWQVFQRTVQDARARNADVPAEEINAAVEEALASVRAERFRTAGWRSRPTPSRSWATRMGAHVSAAQRGFRGESRVRG